MKRTDFRIHPTVCLVLGCLIAFSWGCTKPETEIGLGLQPTSELLDAVVVDTVTVELATVLEDSLETDELSTGLIGEIFVPRFGLVRASLATQLRLSATDVNFGPNPVADSMFLQLRYTGDFYGRLSPERLSVQPLADSLSLDSTYYSNASFSTTGEEWIPAETGPLAFEPGRPTVVGSDTLAAQLRIPLRADVAQSILDLDTTTFDGNASWFSYMPGLLVQHAEGGHGVAAFDISSGLSVMRLHYHNDNDTSSYDFLVSPLSARVNLFENGLLGELGELQEDQGPDDLAGTERAYVLSASGCKVRLRFPHLSTFLDSAGHTPTVLKAELTLPVEEAFFDKPIPAQDQLFVLLEGTDGGFVQSPDQSAPISVGGFYNRSEKAYVFNLSSTVQALMKGQLDGRELYLVSSRAGISISSVVLAGTEAENPARLTLTLGL
jgi:hypothetical protein